MSVALYTTWSRGNAELAGVTHPNHEAFARAQGYERVADELEYGVPANDIKAFERVLELLGRHEFVLMHGTDVLFMNTRWRCESLNQGESVTLAREALGWWPINNDVVLWKNDYSARWLIRLLIDGEPEWRGYQWKWQTYLWNLRQTFQWVRQCIRITPPREMNATPWPGESLWQLGDPVLHFVGMLMKDRVEQAQRHLQYVGDGTWKQ